MPFFLRFTLLPEGGGKDDHPQLPPQASEMVVVPCPQCTSKGKIHKEHMGKSLKCPKCGHKFVAVLPEISKPAKTLLVQPTAKGQEALVGADQEFSTSEPLQAKAALDPANQEGKTESLPKGIILCPQCQAHLDISGVRSGEMVECKCGNRIAVPAKKRNLEMFIGAILVIACAAADAYPFDETLKSTLASIKFVLPVFSGATAIFGSWRICCMLAVASVLMQLGMEIPKFSTSSNPLFSAWNIIIILFYGWLAHSAWKKFRQINRKSK